MNPQPCGFTTASGRPAPGTDSCPQLPTVAGRSCTTVAGSAARRTIAGSRPRCSTRTSPISAAMLTERGVEPVHLVGHSDGGTVALLLAARAPNLVLQCRRGVGHTFAATPRPWLHSAAWVRPTSGLSRCGAASGAPTVTTGSTWRALACALDITGVGALEHRRRASGDCAALSTRCMRSTTICRRRSTPKRFATRCRRSADHLGRHADRTIRIAPSRSASPPICDALWRDCRGRR